MSLQIFFARMAASLRTSVRIPKFVAISERDALECDATMFLVVELCDGDVEGTHHSDAVSRGVAYCMSSALAAMHELGLVHLDLKPSNILYVCGDDCSGATTAMKFYLSDFGCVTWWVSLTRMKSAVWWGRTSTWTRWHWSTNGAAGQRIAFRCLPQKHASFDSLPHTVADTTLLDTVNRLLLPDRRRRLTAAEVRDLISQSSQPNLELEVASGTRRRVAVCRRRIVMDPRDRHPLGELPANE